jgi:hypothetical protein
VWNDTPGAASRLYAKSGNITEQALEGWDVDRAGRCGLRRQWQDERSRRRSVRLVWQDIAEPLEHPSLVRRILMLNFGARKIAAPLLKTQATDVKEGAIDRFLALLVEFAVLRKHPFQLVALLCRKALQEILPLPNHLLLMGRQRIPTLQIPPHLLLALGRQLLKALIVAQDPFLLIRRQIAQTLEKARRMTVSPRVPLLLLFRLAGSRLLSIAPGRLVAIL